MNGHAAEERIAQLQARAQAQRLSAQLAILEAREQLAPLRTLAAVIGAASRAVSSGRATGGMAGALAKFGIGHPWVSSAIAAAALRLVRRRPVAFLVAAAAGAATWRFLGPTAARAGGAQEPNP